MIQNCFLQTVGRTRSWRKVRETASKSLHKSCRPSAIKSLSKNIGLSTEFIIILQCTGSGIFAMAHIHHVLQYLTGGLQSISRETDNNAVMYYSL